jgi:hypothetical protein
MKEPLGFQRGWRAAFLKSRRFKFESGLTHAEMKAEKIGDFMYLLMDGIKRIDEELMKSALI